VSVSRNLFLLAAVFVLAAADIPSSAEPPRAPGILVGADKDEEATARIIETGDTIDFEITGPIFLQPYVAIDVNRNGMIDSDLDFAVSLAANGSPCYQQLLRQGQSSPCRAFGGKVQVTKRQDGDLVTTVFKFPKSVISSDTFGFGFVINLWNEKGHYRSALTAGDYRFGGTIQPVTDGRNFMEEGIQVPSEVLPAIHRYQGCFDRGIGALGGLDRSKLGRLKLVPQGCAADRAAALKDGVDALVAAGAPNSQAQRAMGALLDQIDRNIDRLVRIVEGTGSK
jgi:hypothetical protein